MFWFLLQSYEIMQNLENLIVLKWEIKVSQKNVLAKKTLCHHETV